MADIAISQVLENPDDNPPDDCTRNRIQPAQNHCRKDDQPEVAYLNVYTIDVAKEGPAHAGSHESDCPGNGIDEFCADP